MERTSAPHTSALHSAEAATRPDVSQSRVGHLDQTLVDFRRKRAAQPLALDRPQRAERPRRRGDDQRLASPAFTAAFSRFASFSWRRRSSCACQSGHGGAGRGGYACNTRRPVAPVVRICRALQLENTISDILTILRFLKMPISQRAEPIARALRVYGKCLKPNDSFFRLSPSARAWWRWR